MTSNALESITHSAMQTWSIIQSRIGVDRLFLLLNILVVLLLASSMADWTWRLVRPNLPQVVASTGTANQAGNSQIPDIQLLLNAHLFGQADAVDSQSTPTEVPLSSLNLVLTGIVAAGDDSVALISADGQPQSAFTLGEEVAHGAILHAVYPDRAILQRTGVLESLVLEDIADGLAGNSVSVIKSSAHIDSQIKRLGPNDFSLPRNIIGEKLKDPQFLRAAHIMPRKEGGFLVRRLKKGSLYEKIGLRQGDVITSVNGEPLNSIQDAMTHYSKLNTLSQVQIEVTRNGKPEMLQFHLN
jgi:general secretion pathway protein C